MQANDNNIFDDKFFDKAWDSMKETLDKEMPEEKKRRRFLPWFFLMTGCAIGFLFWFGFSHFNQISIESVLQISNKEEISISKEIPNQEEKISIAVSSPKQKIIENQVVKSKLIASSRKKTNSTIEPQQKQKVKSTVFEKTSLNSIRHQELISSVAAIQKSSINPFDLTTTLPELNDKYLPTDGIANLCPPKRKIEWSIVGGLMYNFSMSKKIGFTSGLQVHFPIRKKWGIQTGIVYSLLRKDISIGTSQNHSAVLSNSSSIDPTLANADLSLYVVNTSAQYQLKNIQYLEIPILATYQLNRKWKLHAGANWSKALNANIQSSSEESLLLIDNDPNSQLGLEVLATSEISAPSVNQEVWKNDFVSSVLGVSWNPTKRLNLNLSYYQRWSDSKFLNHLNNFDLSGAFNNSALSTEAVYDKKGFYRSLRFTAGYRF